MTHPTTGSSRVPRSPRRAARWWLAAGTFVLGLAAGVIITGLLASDSSIPIAGRTVSPDTALSSTAVVGSMASSSSSSSAPGASVQIVVNEACLRAINEGQDAYNAINKIGDAVRDLNLTTLDDIIRQLQPLQGALRADVSGCHVTSRLPDGSLISTALPTTSPAVTPSVAPTPTTSG
jgi:hypothetical protein